MEAETRKGEGEAFSTQVKTSLINDVDSGTKCKLSKFADDAKVSDATDTLEEKDAIQWDLGRLEEWVPVNLMQFNKAKCKVLHMGQGNHQYQHGLGDEWI
ncbi:cAMP-dependent protein kinase inhibitor alpha [Grus japonensis]|uniref:cAMP-dependent protein kinase inhibitor alpha n=1 Tax=Grus japonensis TaxID=30415 RepID=A0ABC9WEA9_GRUJA